MRKKVLRRIKNEEIDLGNISIIADDKRIGNEGV
jgi:hypothetical protein